MNAKEGCVFAGAVSPSAARSGVQGGARGRGGVGQGGGGAGAARTLEPGRGSHLLLVTAGY